MGFFLKNKNRNPEQDLTDGIDLLFNNVNTKLSYTEKKAIYKSLGFTISYKRDEFIDTEPYEESFINSFKANVFPTDLNSDGVEEIFIIYGNLYTSGNAGKSVALYIKNSSGNYFENFNFPGISVYALPEKKDGYNDLTYGGPGFEFGVWRWDGEKYDYYKSISGDELSQIKTETIAYSDYY